MSIVSEILNRSAEPLIGLAAAGMSWVCAWAARWFYFHTKNARLQGITERLNDAAQTAVQELEQSTVKAVKAAAADGKLPGDMAAAVKAAALESMRSHMGPKGIAELKKVLGVQDVTPALSSRIESAVHAASQAKRA